MIPRYATPTKSSRLYTYTNRDQDLIKLGFRAGNFTFLSKFPQRIRPFAVTDSLKAHSRKNLLRTPRSVSVKRAEGYSWMPDSYARKEEVNRRSRAESVNRRKSISSKDFVPSGSANRTPRTQSTYVSINASYSSANDHSARLKWIKDLQIRNGNFRSGRPLAPNKSISAAEEIITELKLRVSKDWKKSNFNVGLNSEKCIELRVFLETVESVESMCFYMNMLVNKSEEFLKYCLKKVPGKWGVKVKGFLVFTLAPGWVSLPGIQQRVRPGKMVSRSLICNRLALISTRNSSLSIHN